ncbi:BEL1-like homeodomain protein 1 [Juglans microcarpa x Juglans regia]|uniref:BEL1-like homeodomain protein 1 n=1 Tax=Juglans microcarpa x Juglans regia TaxID=2249226 RepID=UPI001B7E8C89|nr:BEL1-like homeodomain protein 1 [Juglans microcarpa x Juglans regia]XP_041027107.1 BEL1-like homeodomain protein 1 [Juglans microcarpa x Juglans regia]XP_041027108.1 BEL1-like homeodomain protein 1 [Juglans microcarpa x Juglans regia]XP_041027109.1 BEL1-like homeodomain protein 1 [Juglans microcarpa x Juglans regia]XP_041027110.1 BEL1-like homeodomain protein 1 [Juglans microcarpa x Juglans regia]XP_041027111.1 BEL1-like homeodomain protein 1 [Juglans microcarpa x Juglans regia]XP_04102711
MATYFHGNSEIQAADGLQTLVLMNPAGYVQYSEAPPQVQSTANNFVFLNSVAAAAAANSYLPQAQQPHTQQFVGIPLPTMASAASQDPDSQSMNAHHEISALHGFVPRVQYNLWNSLEPNAAARETPRAQQGLSLSLSSQQPGYGSFRADREVPSQAQASAISGEDMRISGGSSSSASGVTNGVSGMRNVLLSSKYLKAAQELLDEVVNVGNGMKSEILRKANGRAKVMGESSAAESGDGSVGGEASGKRAAELSTAERQEIQMKKAKLLNMLDEVDQRYRQYHNQMQIVISTFEQAAGIGSARTYTALALQTISKQFRCLKDSITGQIRAANKSLGEEDSPGGKIEGSRLKYVDHQLRQQRALQQLGMIQHNAWRPQRGLPERSVSVLRAWLFDHFLHPYPKDSDKHLLAKQTGLTRGQVSNWFINARVRLWKPMVEEMYMEELKEQEQNGSEEKISKSNEDSASKSSAPQAKSPATENRTKSFNSKRENSTNQNAAPAFSVSKASTSPVGGNVRNQSGFTLIGPSEWEGITQGSPKKQRSNEMLHSPSSVPSINVDLKPNEANNEQVSMKFSDERQGRDGYSFMGGQTNFIGGFGQYPIGEIGRYDTEQFAPRYSGNGVSLTLGLPHCENLSLSATHHSFLPNQNIQLGRRVVGEPNDFGAISNANPHSSAAYESINIQNPKRFAAQLLPDFVA